MSRCTFALLIVVIAGCGGDGRASVSGRVVFNGQPLEKGVIRFQPTDDTKSPSAGGDVVDGQYVVHAARGPMAGKFRVEFNALKKTGKKIAAGSPAPPGTMVDEYAEAIPALYTGEKSPLRADVKAGRNTIDFEMKSPGGPP